MPNPKRCFKCGETKPISEFYKHAMMGDGYLNKCKACTKRYVAERAARLVATHEGLEAERARGREKYHRLYAPENPLRFVSPDAPEHVKRTARNVLNGAVRDGKVRKPSVCQDCGARGRIHGHHADYNKPLEVEWLCAGCHSKRHRQVA